MSHKFHPATLVCEETFAPWVISDFGGCVVLSGGHDDVHGSPGKDGDHGVESKGVQPIAEAN